MVIGTFADPPTPSCCRWLEIQADQGRGRRRGRRKNRWGQTGLVGAKAWAVPSLRPPWREETGRRCLIIQVSSADGTQGLSVCQPAQWAVGDFTEVLAREVAPPGMTEDAYVPLTYDLTLAAVQTLFPSQSRHDASPKMGAHHGTHRTGDGWKPSGMARQSPRWRRLTSMPSRTGLRTILTGGRTYARTGREAAGPGAEPSPAECFPFEAARGE